MRRFVALLLLLLVACGAPLPPPSASGAPPVARGSAPRTAPAPTPSAPPVAAARPLGPVALAASPSIPSGISFTSDVAEVGQLVSALQRRPAAGDPGELALSLIGGRSANKPLALAAAQLLDFERRGIPLSDPQYAALIADWRRFYAASRLNWMGDEFFSCIYSSIHLVSNLAVVGWSSRNGGQLDEARWWVAQWWHLADLMATPQGYIAAIGERCGGHATAGRDRAILSWIYANAGGQGSSVARAEAWCQQGGAGLRPHGAPPVGSWEYPALEILLPVLRATYAERNAFRLDAKFEQPLLGVRTPAGDFAYWLAHEFNPNTPPVLAVVYLRSRGDGPGAPQYLPALGGPHFREQASQSACSRLGPMLVFTSPKQGNGSLALPVGAKPEEWGG